MQEPGGWKYGGELAERAGHRKEVVGEDEEKSRRCEHSSAGSQQLVGGSPICAPNNVTLMDLLKEQ